MIDAIPHTVALLLAPIAGWMGKKTVDNIAAIKAHDTRFDAIHESLVDLKNGQQNQTDKLDRLVEKLL